MGVEDGVGAGLTWAEARDAHEAVIAAALSGLSDDDGFGGMGPGARIASEAVRLRTYAKVKPNGQRETWRETVTRTMAYLRHRTRGRVSSPAMLARYDADMAAAARAVFRREVMPSMRLLWAAGDVVEKNDIAVYNCAFAPADSPAIFHEALYVLMHGTGFGFSVERQFVDRLPVPAAPDSAGVTDVHVVGDSTEGWRLAVKRGVWAWFHGFDLTFDTSRVRPAGARLATKGGEASGPEPLLEYLGSLRAAIRGAGAEGRRLRPIEVHDLLCGAGAIVQVGGVRRSAMISFSDRDDAEMRLAKHFPSQVVPPVRFQANNSWVLDDPAGLTWDEFVAEWEVLQSSGAGERGIVAPGRASYRGVPVRGNPCMEIWLAFAEAREAWDGSGGGQFCNLSNVILRPGDDWQSAAVKAEIAAFIGTMQASMTNFTGLRRGWTETTRRDALLGVGLAGQVDCPRVSTDAGALGTMNRRAVATNVLWADAFGIARAAGVTCGKPDGNGSVFLGCASGVHAHHAPHYLRRITVSAKSPVCKVLRAAGVAAIPQTEAQARELAAGTIGPDDVSAWLFELPIAAPAGATVRHDEGALGLLARIETINRGWLGVLGHNQSATVTVKRGEWDDVRDYVWAHRDGIGGLSFFPAEDDEVAYYGAPLTDLTEAGYSARVAALPDVDWSTLALYENGVSEAAQTFACTSGACSIV